jgi:NhaA family Na+:H+ antiporter
MNMFGVRRLWPFLAGFVLLWIAVFQSGIHATIAGVLAALTIPLGKGESHSPLKRLQHRIHPFVVFGVVPLFGFVSAGVTLPGLATAFNPLPVGIALGLFLGKQAGVFGAVWLADRTGVSPKPSHLNWAHIYGAALLCGIGFTMSLFIGALAFPDPTLVEEAKIGTLAGSVVSGLFGYAALMLSKPIPSTPRDDEEAQELFGEDADDEPAAP